MSFKSVLARLHRHRYKPVASLSDLNSGIFTVSAYCRCSDFIVKVLALPIHEEHVPVPGPEDVPAE